MSNEPKATPVPIPPELTKRIDALRGLIPRAAYVRYLISQALDAEEEQAQR